MEAREAKQGSAWGWLRRNVSVRDALTVALVVVLILNFVASAFNAYEAHQTNLNSEENNRILKERDFGRLFSEHEQHRREHAEILKRCGGL